VHGGAIGRAVIGDQALDGDAVAGVVTDGAAQEAHGGEGLFVCEHFDIGQAGGVVDGDVHVLPADGLAVKARDLVPAGFGGVAPDTGDALARAAVDAPELLDVDVDQLAGPRSLLAVRGLQAQAPQPAHADPLKDPRHRRERHAQAFGDLCPGQP
jgi:hypothetical protein